MPTGEPVPKSNSVRLPKTKLYTTNQQEQKMEKYYKITVLKFRYSALIAMTLITPQKQTGFTPTPDNKYGWRFKLHPIQHAYEIDFARSVAGEATAKGRTLNILDLACGNGDMASGMLKEIRESGYIGQVRYAGIDIDPKGVNSVGEKVAVLPDVSIVGLDTVDLRDSKKLDQVLLQDLQGSLVNVFLFGDLLHWLQPNEIQKLLSLVYEKAPTDSRVLATVCSVWNRTSIGNTSNPRQMQRIQEVIKFLENNPDDLLSRSSDQIEYESNMTHFTDRSLSKTFTDVGFKVEDCRWWDNILHSNGIADLPENVKLTARKARGL